jgi:hypothetical protein
LGDAFGKCGGISMTFTRAFYLETNCEIASIYRGSLKPSRALPENTKSLNLIFSLAGLSPALMKSHEKAARQDSLGMIPLSQIYYLCVIVML